MQLCGDETCQDRGCSSEALDAYFEEQERVARYIVRTALGLPVEEVR
jgi:hypothetical protein